MTSEEMERAIEFIADNQGRTSADLKLLTGKVLELTDAVTRMEVQAEIDRKEMRQAITHLETQAEIDRREMREAMTRLEAQTEVNRMEFREAFDNLIIANEVTRKLSEDVARLALGNRERIIDLETKMP